MTSAMRETVVMGVGLHPFGRHPDKSYIDMTTVAVSKALEDVGISFKEIEAAYCGAEMASFVDSRTIIQNFGWTGIPITSYQQACASGSAAFREAHLAVAAGQYDIVLVVGFEKMSKGFLPGGSGPEKDGEYHLHYMGIDITPGRIAMAMRLRMELYGDTVEMFAVEAVQASEYGCLNPNAHYQKQNTLEGILNSPVVCAPLTVFMCCPTSDGAAAAVIMSRTAAKKYGLGRAVNISAYSAGSPDYHDLTCGPGPFIGGDYKGGSLTQRLAGELYERAGVGPEDVDVCQAHIPFCGAGASIAESLGFCAEGEGGPFWVEGKARIDGDTPINTDGGLLTRGHPLGATGVAEVAEIVWQLRGEAGQRQVPNGPKIGLTHNSGVGCLNLLILEK